MNSREFAKRTGATLRQLQWWDEHRIVRAKITKCGSGPPKRVYQEEQVALARDLARIPGQIYARLKLRSALIRRGKTVDEFVEWHGILLPFLHNIVINARKRKRYQRRAA